MMKHVILAAALCAGTFSVQAQTPAADTKTSSATTQKPTPAQHNCMQASDKEWASLGLTAEQTTKVKAIQEEHTRDCAGKAKDEASAAKSMDKHEARIKEVLTPEQYDQWMKWCTAQAAPTKPTDKM